jgi:hypothetical protein
VLKGIPWYVERIVGIQTRYPKLVDRLLGLDGESIIFNMQK